MNEEIKFVIWLNDPGQYYGGGYIEHSPVPEHARSLVNARRYDSIKNAKGSIAQARKGFNRKLYLEPINIDIRPIKITVEEIEDVEE